MDNVHQLIEKYCETYKSYDEIICECDFNSKLRDALFDVIEKKLWYFRGWAKGRFFRDAYLHCGGIMQGGYCPFGYYKKYYFDKLVNKTGEYGYALCVSGMVYALLSVLKQRKEGVSYLLDDLELLLKQNEILPFFKKLVDKTKKRYELEFSIGTRHPKYWDLDDFGFFNCDFFGLWEFERNIYGFTTFFWKEKETRLKALKRLKLYFETEYFGRSIVGVEPDDEWEETARDDYEQFYKAYPEAVKRIEAETDEDVFEKTNVKKENRKEKTIMETFSSNVHLNPQKRKKADLVRVIEVLYELDFFMDKNGIDRSLKKDVYAVFGKALNADFENYDKNLASGNRAGHDKQMNIFRSMEKQANIFKEMIDKKDELIEEKLK